MRQLDIVTRQTFSKFSDSESPSFLLSSSLSLNTTVHQDSNSTAISAQHLGRDQDPRKSPKRCVPALDFPYPDYFSEFYPDSGRYLLIFGPYPDSDIYLKKEVLDISVKKSFLLAVLLFIILFRYPAFHYLDGGYDILP